MSAWSMKFKERMLQLRLAYKDQETGDVVLGNYGEIHGHVLDRLNDKRKSNGLHKLSYDDTYKECRGYVRKDNGKFMKMDDAIKWASSTGYDNDRWSGESIDLRWKQEKMGGKKYY